MRSKLLAGGVFTLLTSCSLGNLPSSPCTINAECREAFGFMSVCGEEGYCTDLSVPDRCSRAYPEDLFTQPQFHEDVVLYGALFDIGTDLDNLKSIELAFIEANEGMGLGGREVGLVTCTYGDEGDNLDASDAAIAGAEFLSNTLAVPGIVGPAASQRVVDIWPTTRPAGTYVISPSATSDELGSIDDARPSGEPRLFWRTAPVDSLQAAAIVSDLSARGVTEVAVVNQTGAYGDGLAASLNAALSLPASRTFSFANNSQLTAAVSDLGDDAALEEIVFISSDADDIVTFLNTSSQVPAFDSLGVFLTDAARSQEVLNGARALAGARFPRVRGTNPAPDPRADPQDDFYLAFTGQYSENGRTDSFNPFSYDAAWLMLYASSWALQQEGAEGASVEDILIGRNLALGMAQLSSGSRVEIRGASWPLDIEGPFTAGQSIDVFGASGVLDFDPTTGETDAPISVWTINAAGDDFVDDKVCYAGVCESFTPLP